VRVVSGGALAILCISTEGVKGRSVRTVKILLVLLGLDTEVYSLLLYSLLVMSGGVLAILCVSAKCQKGLAENRHTSCLSRRAMEVYPLLMMKVETFLRSCASPQSAKKALPK
jgi:hypothetical protein